MALLVDTIPILSTVSIPSLSHEPRKPFFYVAAPSTCFPLVPLRLGVLPQEVHHPSFPICGKPRLTRRALSGQGLFLHKYTVLFTLRTSVSVPMRRSTPAPPRRDFPQTPSLLSIGKIIPPLTRPANKFPFPKTTAFDPLTATTRKSTQSRPFESLSPIYENLSRNPTFDNGRTTLFLPRSSLHPPGGSRTIHILTFPLKKFSFPPPLQRTIRGLGCPEM